MPGDSDYGVDGLYSGQDPQLPPGIEATAGEHVVDVITTGRKRRLAFPDSAHKTGQEIENRQRREPQAMHRRYHPFCSLADAQRHPDDSETKQRAAAIAHERPDLAIPGNREVEDQKARSSRGNG